jgi:hypothetical protein
MRVRISRLSETFSQATSAAASRASERRRVSSERRNRTYGLRSGDTNAPFDHDRCEAVIEVAEAAGAGPFVALDLYVEMVRPGWSPFPMPRVGEDR